MTTEQRRAWAAVVVAGLAASCGGAAQGPRAAPASIATKGNSAPPPAAEHVVVSIVVDQLAAWLVDARLGELPEAGGFARLRREGTYARDMRYAHAATDTAPGHSSLYTGRPPRESGIFINEVLDASGGKISILADPDTRLVARKAVDRPGASARALLPGVDTVADRFRAAHRDATIVSLSLKDRGAIFGGGRTPTASVWWDRGLGAFVTSTAFASTLPPFVPEVRFPMTWELSAEEQAWIARHAKTPDDQPGEGDLGGLGARFPHTIANGNAFRATPFADEALVAMAESAMTGVHAPALLALSFSANDYVGHTFGPDSWEAWSELRRLDATLAALFAWLDGAYGPAGWDAVLSADHGVTTMPEAASDATRPWCASGALADRWQRACGPVKRLMPKGLGVLDPYVFLRPGEDRAAITAKLTALPEVARVIDTRALPATCPGEADESLEALVCRSYLPGHGDLFVVLQPGDFFDPDVVEGKGTSHGSPYVFDRSVPLFVRAPGRAAAGHVVDAPISFRAFARALASLLGVDPESPEAARALDLTRPR